MITRDRGKYIRVAGSGLSGYLGYLYEIVSKFSI